MPLTNFHTWTLSSATVKSGSTSGVISSFPDDELTMVNGSNAREGFDRRAERHPATASPCTWVRST